MRIQAWYQNTTCLILLPPYSYFYRTSFQAIYTLPSIQWSLTAYDDIYFLVSFVISIFVHFLSSFPLYILNSIFINSLLCPNFYSLKISLRIQTFHLSCFLSLSLHLPRNTLTSTYRRASGFWNSAHVLLQPDSISLSYWQRHLTNEQVQAAGWDLQECNKKTRWWKLILIHTLPPYTQMNTLRLGGSEHPPKFTHPFPSSTQPKSHSYGLHNSGEWKESREREWMRRLKKCKE